MLRASARTRRKASREGGWQHNAPVRTPVGEAVWGWDIHFYIQPTTGPEDTHARAVVGPTSSGQCLGQEDARHRARGEGGSE